MGSGLTVTATAVVACVGILLVLHKLFGAERRLDHEVASADFAMVGVLHAVPLAFVVVEVWQAGDDAQQYSQAETNDVAQVYFTARALPEPQRTRLTTLCRAYAETVVRRAPGADGHGGRRAARLHAVARLPDGPPFAGPTGTGPGAFTEVPDKFRRC